MTDAVWEIARLIYAGLSGYALWVLVTRWRVVKVMTEERRWLFMFLAAETLAAMTSGVAKALSGAPGDSSVFLTLFTQALLGAYLHNFVPRERRPWWTRSSRTRGTPASS